MCEDEETTLIDNLRNKIIFLGIDFCDFLGNIEMRIKHFLNKDFYKNLSEDDIPNNTFYCYGGCRFNSKYCPFMDFSIIAKSKYCHYVKGGLGDPLLYDSCKICGIKELEEE